MLAMLPARSIATKWVVPATSDEMPAVRGSARGGVPASYLPSGLSGEIRAERRFS
jgi:hypothetical protein